MSTLQAVMLGMMLSWTPSLLLFAYLIWRAPLIEPSNLDQATDMKPAIARPNHFPEWSSRSRY
jgi:hypothetical protein